MLAALVTFGCGSEGGVAPGVDPAILAAEALPNPHSVLSIIVSTEVENADSIAVLYGRTGEQALQMTPVAAHGAGPTEVAVLGLEPETSYRLTVVAFSGARSAERVLPDFVTGSLPPDLPTYVAGGSDPSPGFIVFAARRYGLAIDNTGRVVWYRAFANGPGLNFQPQPNGRFVARPPPPDPFAIARWVEVDPLGRETRTFGCDRGLQPRFHDLIVETDGDYWILCDETRTMDLSAYGGSSAARVTGTVVQQLDAAEALLFEWSAFDHFDISDLSASSLTSGNVNWTHGNALSLDVDGHLIVSFRNLNEVTKIDAGSGSVLWRMGGARNQFDFGASPTPAFARQHGLRVTGAGRLTLLDNSGDPGASHAERYEYDPVQRTARLVDSYGPAPSVIAQLGGTTQELPGGRMLVAFGDGDRVQEYGPSGAVVWEIEGSAGYVFRAERIASLYHPGSVSIPLP